MRIAIQDSGPKTEAIFDLQSAISCSGRWKPQITDRESAIWRFEFRVFFLLLCLLLIFAVQAAVPQVIYLRVLNADGDSLASLTLIQEQSKTYVLEREIKELFSGTATYKPVIGQVTHNVMGKRIVFTRDQRVVKVDGEEYILSSSPIFVSDQMAIPVEFLSEVLPRVIDKQVLLDRENWTLQIRNEPFMADSGTAPGSNVPIKSDAEFRVIIDPGHGGLDSGARTGIGQLEKEQTLGIAQQIQNLLAGESGVAVYLTRNSDRYMTTAERVNFANKLRGHVYVSIHFNWSPSQRPKGFRIYVNSNRARLVTESNPEADVFSKGEPLVSESPEMKRFLPNSKRLAKELAKRLKDSGLTGEQEKEIFLVDMNNLSMPSILVEVLYFSNREDQAILSGPGFTDSVARVFCDAILALRDVLKGGPSL